MRTGATHAWSLLAIISGLSVVLAGCQNSTQTQPKGPPLPGSDAVFGLPAVGGSVTQPTTAGLQAALNPTLNDPALGGAAEIAVVHAGSGQMLYESNSSVPTIPASTQKLITAASVLTALGPDQRLSTKVVRNATGGLILVGAGDPLLMVKPQGDAPDAPASLSALADQVKASLQQNGGEGGSSYTLSYDDSLFTGPETAPSWPPNYVSDGLVAPITALMADGGRPQGKITDAPSKATADTFAKLLEDRGINIEGAVARGAADVAAMPVVGSVTSPPISDLVQHTLEISDNTAAEVLAHLAGQKITGVGSFEGGAAAAMQVLGDLGVQTDQIELFDGSGLSRDDRVTPLAFAQLIKATASNTNPSIWAVVTGMPVAGFTGTLSDRFVVAGTEMGRGYVAAKTGTLSGVSTLAGLTVDADGDLLAFAFMTPNAVGSEAAAAAWDRAAATLSECGCK